MAHASFLYVGFAVKSMNIQFVRRCKGGVRATATLAEDDYRRIHEDDRGNIKVDVVIQDESGNEPIKAEMIWAWVPKNPTTKGTKPSQPQTSEPQ